jgi:hypothetical protein
MDETPFVEMILGEAAARLHNRHQAARQRWGLADGEDQ